MIRVALAALLVLPAVAVAQTPPSPPQAAPMQPDAAPSPPLAAPSPSVAGLVGITLTTALGPVVLAIDKAHAPITAANFLRYVDQKRLDGTVFYRTVKVQENFGFIQFGTQNDPKRTLPPIAHEPTTKTGLSHVDGAISMAMATPGTAGGDFFIIVGDSKSMDATPANPGYAVFGRVIAGMDVIHKILDAPTSPTKGVGMMKGQMLEPTFRVATARRSSIPAGVVNAVALPTSR